MTKICKSCSKEFDISTNIDGKRVQLTGRNRCLECHPYKDDIGRLKKSHVCQRCKEIFYNGIEIDGEIHYFGPPRKYCYSCSPFKSYKGQEINHSYKWKEIDGILNKLCGQCNEFLPYTNDNFLILRKKEGCKKRSTTCKNCEYKKNRDRHSNRKQELVNMHGGCCNLCHYKEYIGALEFHHINPSEKDKNYKQLIRLSPELVLQELEKCILVCVNCHREIHGHLHDNLDLNELKRSFSLRL